MIDANVKFLYKLCMSLDKETCDRLYKESDDPNRESLLSVLDETCRTGHSFHVGNLLDNEVKHILEKAVSTLSEDTKMLLQSKEGWVSLFTNKTRGKLNEYVLVVMFFNLIEDIKKTKTIKDIVSLISEANFIQRLDFDQFDILDVAIKEKLKNYPNNEKIILENFLEETRQAKSPEFRDNLAKVLIKMFDPEKLDRWTNDESDALFVTYYKDDIECDKDTKISLEISISYHMGDIDVPYYSYTVESNGSENKIELFKVENIVIFGEKRQMFKELLRCSDGGRPLTKKAFFEWIQIIPDHTVIKIIDRFCNWSVIQAFPELKELILKMKIDKSFIIS